jgi:iron complex outermembrane receptor protein
MFERSEISIFIIFASMACTWSPAAIATDASLDLANSDQISEIIVTAQKRSERLNDVPMSITALTGDRLQELQVLQVSDLSRVVPGFAYQPSDYGTPVYSIRGIGFKDVAVAVAPTVSVYVDQVPIPYSVETPGAAFDVDRVEVLKGPQGTLFGQNSTGGAINFIAAKPTRTFDAGADVTYGRFQETDVQGFVSGPLSDTFSGRIALRTEQRGDWQISETRPQDTLGERNFSTGRALLDWQPDEALKAELNINGWIDKSDTQAAQFVQHSPSVPNGYPDQTAALSVYQPAPNDARIADWKQNISLKRDDNFYQSSLNLQWAISEAVSLSSITAWSEFKQDAPTDTDGFNLGNFLMTIKAHIQSLSQEVRLSGSKSNALHWMVGLNYEDDQSSDDQYGFDYGSNSGIGPLRWHYSDNSNHQTIDTKAAFGSLDYALTDAFTFQSSIRYTTANDDFHGCLRDPGDGGLATAFSLLTINAIQPGACVTLDPATGLSVPIVQKTLHENNLSCRAGIN